MGETNLIRRGVLTLPSGAGALTLYLPQEITPEDAIAAADSLSRIAHELRRKHGPDDTRRWSWDIVGGDKGAGDPAPNSPADVGYPPRTSTPAAPRREPGREWKYAIPPSAPQKPCRSCNAPIVFVKTEAGRSMPVNPDTGLSHFTTCPNANDWSGGRR
jgi:hypothetical protein